MDFIERISSEASWLEYGTPFNYGLKKLKELLRSKDKKDEERFETEVNGLLATISEFLNEATFRAVENIVTRLNSYQKRSATGIADKLDAKKKSAVMKPEPDQVGSASGIARKLKEMWDSKTSKKTKQKDEDELALLRQCQQAIRYLNLWLEKNKDRIEKHSPSSQEKLFQYAERKLEATTSQPSIQEPVQCYQMQDTSLPSIEQITQIYREYNQTIVLRAIELENRLRKTTFPGTLKDLALTLQNWVKNTVFLFPEKVMLHSPFSMDKKTLDTQFIESAITQVQSLHLEYKYTKTWLKNFYSWYQVIAQITPSEALPSCTESTSSFYDITTSSKDELSSGESDGSSSCPPTPLPRESSSSSLIQKFERFFIWGCGEKSLKSVKKWLENPPREIAATDGLTVSSSRTKIAGT